MGLIAIVFGVLLSILGVVLYAMSESASPTPLIPTLFGLALIGLGWLAFKEKLRMHAMHGAALLGLIGLVIPLFMIVRGRINGADWKLPATGQAIMAALCGVFLAVCVKSFIDARRRRKQASGEAT